MLHAPYPLPDPDHPGLELRAAQNPYSEEVSTLRVMNALIVSPDANLLTDNDSTTFEPTRQNPPAGLKAASSELMNVASLHTAGFKVVASATRSRSRSRRSRRSCSSTAGRSS
jgi:glycerophosphoryl diester phosphodiesterase